MVETGNNEKKYERDREGGEVGNQQKRLFQ
jgi:hypothetical protein